MIEFTLRISCTLYSRVHLASTCSYGHDKPRLCVCVEVSTKVVVSLSVSNDKMNPKLKNNVLPSKSGFETTLVAYSLKFGAGIAVGQAGPPPLPPEKEPASEALGEEEVKPKQIWEGSSRSATH